MRSRVSPTPMPLSVIHSVVRGGKNTLDISGYSAYDEMYKALVLYTQLPLLQDLSPPPRTGRAQRELPRNPILSPEGGAKGRSPINGKRKKKENGKWSPGWSMERDKKVCGDDSTKRKLQN